MGSRGVFWRAITILRQCNGIGEKERMNSEEEWGKGSRNVVKAKGGSGRCRDSNQRREGRCKKRDTILGHPKFQFKRSHL